MTIGSAGGAAPGEAASQRAPGHRLVAHTADVILEAWGPDRESCLREAILGMVASFADIGGATVQGSFPLFLGMRSDDDALGYLLEEVIYSVEVRRLVPVNVTVEPVSHDGPCIILRVAPLDYRVRIVGACPKAVSRQDLHIASDQSGTWCARVTLGV
jgi:SHS2 domain-containing protein